jgi:hypothetical protein
LGLFVSPGDIRNAMQTKGSLNERRNNVNPEPTVFSGLFMVVVGNMVGRAHLDRISPGLTDYFSFHRPDSRDAFLR